MTTNLAGVPFEEYEFGMALQAGFEELAGNVTLVVFRRAE